TLRVGEGDHPGAAEILAQRRHQLLGRALPGRLELDARGGPGRSAALLADVWRRVVDLVRVVAAEQRPVEQGTPAWRGRGGVPAGLAPLHASTSPLPAQPALQGTVP